MEDRKIVIIPTYNEKENIENIIRKVFTLEGGYDVLVIDDGSPDGTAAIVKGLQQEFPSRLFMIERKGKLGLGTAYITGFRWSIANGYDYTFEMDAETIPGMQGRSGPRNRLQILRRHQRNQLAYRTYHHVLLCIGICQDRSRNESLRLHGRIQVLQQ